MTFRLLSYAPEVLWRIGIQFWKQRKRTAFCRVFSNRLDRKIPQVAAADIGRVVVESMQEKTDGIEIKELAGFWISPEETAEAFGKVLGAKRDGNRGSRKSMGGDSQKSQQRKKRRIHCGNVQRI